VMMSKTAMMAQTSHTDVVRCIVVVINSGVHTVDVAYLGVHDAMVLMTVETVLMKEAALSLAHTSFN